MVFSEISLQDKPLFDGYLGSLRPEASEFTFTNFFMWRKYYKFRYTVSFKHLCIIADMQDTGPFALLPIGDFNPENFKNAVLQLKEYFREMGWKPVFRRVTEKQLELFKGAGMPECSIVHDRDNSDYLYAAQDMIHLKGKKYDGKRNHINKFRKNHSFEYVELTEELIPECERIMEEWCKARNCDCEHDLHCERYANLELLRNYNVLNCKGALIRVDGRFEAFTVGEMLNGNTTVIHIEKAGNTIDGLYTIVNQQFCEHVWYSAEFVNREQDLGVEGLRKAKLSYSPVRMIDKYIVTLNE